MTINQIISEFYLEPYMLKYKYYCISSDFLDHIQSVNNIRIINSSPLTIKTIYFLPTIKNFLEQSGNLLFKIGSKDKIYQPKPVVFMNYYILFFYVVDILTVNFSIFM